METVRNDEDLSRNKLQKKFTLKYKKDFLHDSNVVIFALTKLSNKNVK